MTGCDAVVHLAALIAIPYSYLAPKSYLDTNISGTLNILEAARELRANEPINEMRGRSRSDKENPSSTMRCSTDAIHLASAQINLQK